MAGKIIEHKFVDVWGMSYNDWFGGKTPNYKYKKVNAPEDA